MRHRSLIPTDQWSQVPSSDTEEEDLAESEADETPDFEGMVIANQEMFDQLVAMVTPPPDAAPEHAGNPIVAGSRTRIEPSYYEKAGVYGYGFEPEIGLCWVFVKEECDADLMDTSAD